MHFLGGGGLTGFVHWCEALGLNSMSGGRIPRLIPLENLKLVFQTQVPRSQGLFLFQLSSLRFTWHPGPGLTESARVIPAIC